MVLGTKAEWMEMVVVFHGYRRSRKVDLTNS